MAATKDYSITIDGKRFVFLRETRGARTVGWEVAYDDGQLNTCHKEAPEGIFPTLREARDALRLHRMVIK